MGSGILQFDSGLDPLSGAPSIPWVFLLRLHALLVMTPTSRQDSADLVRIIGRTIFVVNVIVGAFIILASGIESGPDGTIWHIGPIAAGIALFVSGPFMWAMLRGIAQVRDRMDDLLENLDDEV